MKLFLFLTLVLALAASGCITKAKARAQAQAAFTNGLREGMMRAQEQGLAKKGPSVSINGPVQNKELPWSPGLSLARALVQAVYIGTTDPQRIVVTRNGEKAEIPTQRLLSGEDFKLEPGDQIDLE